MPQAPPSRGDVADGDRGVDRGGQEALRDALGLEQAAVGEHPVQPHALGLLQDVHADPQRGQGREQVRPHEGAEVEPAVRGPQEERPALLEVGDRLAGEVVVGEHPAAVARTVQRGGEERLEDLRRVDLDAQRPGELGEQPGPGVQLAGPVVAVHHRHRVAGRRGDQVQLAVHRAELAARARPWRRCSCRRRRCRCAGRPSWWRPSPCPRRPRAGRAGCRGAAARSGRAAPRPPR